VPAQGVTEGQLRFGRGKDALTIRPYRWADRDVELDGVTRAPFLIPDDGKGYKWIPCTPRTLMISKSKRGHPEREVPLNLAGGDGSQLPGVPASHGAGRWTSA